jgi:uncharacterized membrane protein
MNWEIFIGRFHPVLVHLPIGIFFLGFVLEVFARIAPRKVAVHRNTVILTYAIGLLAAVFAAITGWLLSFSDDYRIDALQDHKLLGIATIVMMVFVVIYQVRGSAEKEKLKLAASAAALVLTGLTGHFGGNLTHGPDYLTQYAPRLLSSQEKSLFETVGAMHPDSVQIYTDLIQPLLQDHCVDCHNSENNKGRLILESYADLFKDQDHERPVTAGDLEQSELFKRISLPAGHEKAMPPLEAGFSYTDIGILKYWIVNGADSLAGFDSDNMPEELIRLIQRDYGLDYSPRPYYEKVRVDSLGEERLEQLRNSGFRAGYLSQENFLLDVSFASDSIGIENIEALNQVTGYVTFLKISNCELSDELIGKMNDLQHLTRVDLSKNQLGEASVSFLLEQPNLEIVNLNETRVDQALLQQLLKHERLRRVYVSNTNIGSDEMQSLRQNHQQVEIVSDFSFKEVKEAKSVFAQE